MYPQELFPVSPSQEPPGAREASGCPSGLAGGGREALVSERDWARRAFAYVLGMMGFFAAVLLLVRVVQPTGVEHFTVMFGLTCGALAALAIWIWHDAICKPWR
jgi:hypothetical protein